MREVCHIDFETFSPVDIKSAGADVYAAHPEAEVLCIAWAVGNKAPALWRPGDADPVELLEHVAGGGPLCAWNSYFELTVFERIVSRERPAWPQPRLEQFRDAMSFAAAAALPLGLGECAAAMALPTDAQKDKRGKYLITALCKPQTKRDGTVWRRTPESDPALFAELYDYCKQDVIAEREVTRRLRPLSPAERELWLVDQRINKRGMRLDLEAIEALSAAVSSEAARLNSVMHAATGGAVPATTQIGALADFVRDHGFSVDSLDKDGIRQLLKLPDLPPGLRRVLEVRQEAGKASTAKLRRMAGQALGDGRVRGQYSFHGSTTGRWAARGIQVQNLPRPKIKPREVREALELFAGGVSGIDAVEFGYGKPLDVVSWCLRGLIVPRPGCEIVGGDFANIEGRVLAWMAAERWKLDAFRHYDAGTGPDLYKLAYARAFGVEPGGVTADQRQIGKVMELALGYQGGVGAFVSMAATYNANLADITTAVLAAATPEAIAEAERKRLWLQVEHGQHAHLPAEQYRAIRLLVDAWRAAHPETKSLWRDIEECAISAVKHRGTEYRIKSGLVSYAAAKHFLYCKLPSGRLLSYARPSVEWVKNELTGENQQVLHYWAVGKDKGDGNRKKKFEGVFSYGGLLTENADQAIARDVQGAAMVRVERRGWPIVLHTHDEIRCETPVGSVSPGMFAEEMGRPPDWSAGLPIAVECETMQRYHK